LSTIIDIHKLAGLISPAGLEILDEAAALQKKNSNISFKVIKVTDNEFQIRTEQGKHLSENYADAKLLVQRTKGLFSFFGINKTLHVHPVPYAQSRTDVVNPKWLNDKMLKNGIKVKDIANETGIEKSDISSWINGEKPMSQPVKAMFYYYFSKEK